MDIKPQDILMEDGGERLQKAIEKLQKENTEATEELLLAFFPLEKRSKMDQMSSEMIIKIIRIMVSTFYNDAYRRGYVAKMEEDDTILSKEMSQELARFVSENKETIDFMLTKPSSVQH